MSNVIHVTDENFQSEVLDSNAPVLVDFWAEWCGPCRAIAPVIDELADEYVDKVKITKLNTEHSTSTPAKYGIRGIPTMLLFENGEVVDQIVGVTPKTVIANMLDKVSGSN